MTLGGPRVYTSGAAAGQLLAESLALKVRTSVLNALSWLRAIKAVTAR